MRYTNPWAGKPGFVDLGTLSWIDLTGDSPVRRYYDLYALTNERNTRSVDLGARYGNEGSQYLSGTAEQTTTGEWEFRGGKAILTAAAKYLANFAHTKVEVTTHV